MGWVVNATPWPPYPREKDIVLTVQEAGWAPRQVWTDDIRKYSAYDFKS
jgi:hypothetical protein